MAELPGHSLTMLQHADSAFPSGSVSFSWGLEALVNRGMVSDASGLAEFLTVQIINRWAGIDRVMLVHAHLADGASARLQALDALLEAQTLASEQRTGSRRMGAAFLAVHDRLGSHLAGQLRRMVAEGQMCGHASIVQGAVWGGLGFSQENAQTMAVHGLCSAVLSAAVRLAVIGHIDVQTIYTQLQPRIGDMLASPVGKPDEAHCFIPQIEIASMLHETDQMRLFVN